MLLARRLVLFLIDWHLAGRVQFQQWPEQDSLGCRCMNRSHVVVSAASQELEPGPWLLAYLG